MILAALSTPPSPRSHDQSRRGYDPAGRRRRRPGRVGHRAGRSNDLVARDLSGSPGGAGAFGDAESFPADTTRLSPDLRPRADPDARRALHVRESAARLLDAGVVRLRAQSL